jgi:chromosomal replication initiation ATPase DnaA
MNAAAMIARAKEIHARLMFPPNGRASSELEVVSAVALRRRRVAATAPRRRPSFTRLLKAVSRHYDIDEAAIRSARRRPDLVLARQVLCHLARRLTPLSCPQIGAALRRDHTTVIHADRKIRRLVSIDAALASDLAAIRQSIAADSW